MHLPAQVDDHRLTYELPGRVMQKGEGISAGRDSDV